MKTNNCCSSNGSKQDRIKANECQNKSTEVLEKIEQIEEKVEMT
jgi:hypothetical protein